MEEFEDDDVIWLDDVEDEQAVDFYTLAFPTRRDVAMVSRI